MLTIVQAESGPQITSARSLFREYEKWLGLDLCFQGFEAELRDLPGKYAKPEGRLLLAYADELLAGCIALRKLEDGICEMKRLFVRDGFRGKKVGANLIEQPTRSDTNQCGSTLIRQRWQKPLNSINLTVFPLSNPITKIPTMVCNSWNSHFSYTGRL